MKKMKNFQNYHKLDWELRTLLWGPVDQTMFKFNDHNLFVYFAA